MKNFKLSLLGILFVTGTLFAMEEPEAITSNLTHQEELLAGIEENNPEKVKNALENGADPNKFKCMHFDENRINGRKDLW